MLYRLVRWLLRLSVWIWFRHVEIEGRSNVPSEGPILLIPNHPNSLIDPLMVMTPLNRRVTITAKSTLFSIPVLGWFMRHLGVVAFHRVRDRSEGSDPRQNRGSLNAIGERLSQLDAVCIFAEGESHLDPEVRPFKNGAARVALQFVDEHPDEHTSLSMIPVGLNFERVEQFRSSAVVRFGESIDVVAWRREHLDARPAALTDLLESRVRDMTINAGRRRERRLITWAAELVATRGEPPRPLGRDEDRYAVEASIAQRIGRGYEQLRHDHPEEIIAIADSIERFRSDLTRLGIHQTEIFLKLDLSLAARFVLRELLLLVIFLLPAIWGTLVFLIPFQAVRLIARRSTKERVARATYSVFPGMAVFLGWTVILIAASWFILTPWLAALFSVTLPCCGVLAIHVQDRLWDAIRRARTYSRFRRNTQLHRDLQEEAGSLLRRIRALAERLDNGVSAIQSGAG